jgi:hypothetical protein
MIEELRHGVELVVVLGLREQAHLKQEGLDPRKDIRVRKVHIARPNRL